MTSRSKRLVLGLAVAATVAGSLFQFGYRPWQRSWGATREEVTRPMPGDDFVRTPAWTATRAVALEAEPERVWPWLVQLGYRRGGFYSWDRLDNAGIPSARRILPEYQGLKQGDLLPVSAQVNLRVRHLEAPRALVLSSEEGADVRWSWAWVLYPDAAGGTRLVSRLRLEGVGWTTRLLLDAGELIMMRKHLLGIRERAEDRLRRQLVRGRHRSWRARGARLQDLADCFVPVRVRVPPM